MTSAFSDGRAGTALSNQLALEAAVMGLTLWAEQQQTLEVGENVGRALHTTCENAGHIKQGVARLGGWHSPKCQL